jgi:hypothetical protein
MFVFELDIFFLLQIRHPLYVICNTQGKLCSLIHMMYGVNCLPEKACNHQLYSVALHHSPPLSYSFFVDRDVSCSLAASVVDTAAFVEVCLLVQLLLSIARVGCSATTDGVADGVVAVAPVLEVSLLIELLLSATRVFPGNLA